MPLKQNLEQHKQNLTPAQITQIMNLQNELLQDIVLVNQTQATLDKLCHLAEHLLPNAVASIMLLDNDKQGLHVFAAPSIPDVAIQALNGLQPGPHAGSCGTAVYREEPVFVSNTFTDKRWENLKQIAYDFNICACWSMPVLNEQGQAIGSFALSSFESRKPEPFHRKILDTCAFLVGIILQRKQQQNLLEERNQLTEEINTELQLTLEVANKAKHEAEQANHAKSVFLAGMSHELRTPLNSILGYTQILARDRHLGQKQHEGIDIIYNSGKHLLSIINDILDISKIESGQMHLHQYEFDFQSFLQDLSVLFQTRAQTLTSVHYRPDFASDLPQVIYADDTRLRQILFNLLDNAFKFTHQGNIYFQVLVHEQQLHFKIQDQGIGIDKQHVDKIFSPFLQLGNVLNKAEGTGLGLSITKNLIEMMSGQLDLNSELGSGTEVCVSLPLQLGQHQPSITNPLIACAYRAPASQVYRLLIADDHKESRRLLFELLSPLGFIIKTVADGKQALLETQMWQPDLIFMDLMMPEMNGLDAIAQIKQDPSTLHIPIVAISASVYPEHKNDSLSLGSKAFIAKPFVLNQITQVIGQCLPLEWDYENVTTSPAETRVTALNISPVQSQRLHDLLEQGDRHALEVYLESIKVDLDAELLAKLQQLIKNFDDEGLYALLDTQRVD